jgi:hypothetical protein
MPNAKTWARDKEKIKAQRLLTKDETKEYKKSYYQNNKESLRIQQAEYYSQLENRAKRMLAKSVVRAKEIGLEHNIDITDIIIPDRCPYLNIELTHDLMKGQITTNSSLDRIDSTKGYIKGNVQVISRLANTMKNSATLEQLIEFATNILKLHNNKEN